jgi:hypothetical protein
VKTATAGLRIAKAGADNWREQAFKPLAGFGQLCRNARRTRMHLGANMVSDEPHDALAIIWRQTFAGIDQTTRQPIDPEPTVGIEHDLDDPGVFQEQRDGRSERGA